MEKKLTKRQNEIVDVALHLIAENGGCGRYCDACFSGKYPTEEPKCTAKSRFEFKKSERRPEEE